MFANAIEKGSKLMKDCIPPAGADPAQLAAWRKSVFVALVLLSLAATASAVHVVLAKGFIGEGFAHAGDVELLLAEQSANSRRQLVNDITNRRERQCKALKDRNSEAARLHGRILTERRLEYETLTGREFPLLSCREAGVEWPP